jgi:hypothetical protein
MSRPFPGWERGKDDPKSSESILFKHFTVNWVILAQALLRASGGPRGPSEKSANNAFVSLSVAKRHTEGGNAAE